MRSPYGTIASIGCMPMQTCIWRSIIEIHARPLLTLLCLLQLDHPNGDNSLLREAVVATTIYRYGHIYDDYDFDTYLRIMRRHGEHANSTVYRTHSISNSMWVADNEWGDDWTLLAFSAENKIRVRVVSSASNQVSDAHCAPPHYCTTPQYCALSECCTLSEYCALPHCTMPHCNVLCLSTVLYLGFCASWQPHSSLACPKQLRTNLGHSQYATTNTNSFEAREEEPVPTGQEGCHSK